LVGERHSRRHEQKSAWHLTRPGLLMEAARVNKR
jgi:hypothetical protein